MITPLRLLRASVVQTLLAFAAADSGRRNNNHGGTEEERPEFSVHEIREKCERRKERKI